MTLVEFLRARLDEDEQAAKRVPQPYRLYVSAEGRLSEPLDDEQGGYAQWADGDDRMPNHITNWELVYDPVRVLAEVEAKRRMLNDLYPSVKASDEAIEGEWMSNPGDSETLLALLALPYADHPEYQQEWRP